MKYYFSIQRTRLSRKLKDLGINPYIAGVLSVVVFIVGSKMLFIKTDFASWIYVSFLISLLVKLIDHNRINQLKNIFLKADYLKLRIIENSFLVLPFLLYLGYEEKWYFVMATFFLVPIFAFISNKRRWISTLPTPFRKWPFEFIVGFRKTFWLIGFAYFLIFKAIQIGNYNLGIFGLGLIFLICMSFYQKPESKYFVWIYNFSAKQFLLRKFVIAVIGAFILSILAWLALIIGFPENWLISSGVLGLGFVFQSSIIVAKYSAYPSEMSLPQAVFYVLSLLFPPLLLVSIWIFYKQSLKRLEPILL